MWIQQIALGLLCAFLLSSKTDAVVNNATRASSASESNKNTEQIGKSEETNDEANRRESPIGFSDAYGPPLALDSYNIGGFGNSAFPVPVYGAPNAPSNNIVYPPPPPDIPPPIAGPTFDIGINTINLPNTLGQIHNTYGIPKPQYGPPKPAYGPPKNNYGPPKNNYGPPKNNYGPPKSFYGPPKNTYGPPKSSYGPPKNIYNLPKIPYGPPINTYGPPKNTYGPPKIIPNFQPPHVQQHDFKIPRPTQSTYGPPHGPHKPIYGPPNFQFKPPHVVHPIRPIYGPPKVVTQYGPPLFESQSIQLGGNINPPKINYPIQETHATIANVFGSSNLYASGGNNRPAGNYGLPVSTYGTPVTNYGLPVNNYGPPSNNYGPPKQTNVASIQYGPPEPIPHGPPHPGAPAPPTPPDIKYDGWQPIPGLISQAPSNNVVSGEQHVGDLQFNNDFVPPPTDLSLHSEVAGNHKDVSNHGLPSTEYSLSHASSLSSSSHSGSHAATHLNSYNSGGISDSYGAPLNVVTGSGGVAGSSKNHANSFIANLASQGVQGSDFDNSLSVIKSIGYELNHGSGGGVGSIASQINLGGDSYSSPPADSFSPNGPYAAAQSHKQHNDQSSFGLVDSLNSYNAFNSFDNNAFNIQFSDIGDGLIPPNGEYGVPPNGKYGTPLLQPPNQQYLNALAINPPKNPVVFRKPVPNGLIESIGHSVAQKDAHNIIENVHSGSLNGETYVPPPIPEVTKPRDEYIPPQPSSLYTLPTQNNPISFQSVIHGNSFDGINGGLSFSQLNADSNFVFSLNDAQTAALTSYTAPLGVVEGTYALPTQESYHHSFEVNNNEASKDLAGNYATNVAGYEAPIFAVPPAPHDCPLHKQELQQQQQFNYATTQLSHNHVDSQTAYSQSNANIVNEAAVLANSIIEPRGKATDNELIKSQSIDLNNIDVQGALGRYTLQIQSADGLNSGESSADIPHNQVLNDGLLQSILAAIEQPQTKYTQQQHLSAKYQQFKNQLSENTGEQEAQHSQKTAVIINPPVEGSIVLKENTTIVLPSQVIPPIPVLDDNAIALYFNKTSSKNQYEVKEDEDVRNGQQYGAYVSFKTPEANYAYGGLLPSNDTTTGAQK